VSAANEMSFDDFDKKTVVFRAKAGSVLIFFAYFLASRQESKSGFKG
jgi:hypothetical protein